MRRVVETLNPKERLLQEILPQYSDWKPGYEYIQDLLKKRKDDENLIDREDLIDEENLNDNDGEDDRESIE